MRTPSPQAPPAARAKVGGFVFSFLFALPIAGCPPSLALTRPFFASVVDGFFSLSSPVRGFAFTSSFSSLFPSRCVAWSRARSFCCIASILPPPPSPSVCFFFLSLYKPFELNEQANWSTWSEGHRTFVLVVRCCCLVWCHTHRGNDGSGREPHCGSVCSPCPHAFLLFLSLSLCYLPC